MTTRCQLVIFEGADGSGKTTAAKEFANSINARYVHFSALPRVADGLARIYVEAMLPALLGYQSVVFDRSWLSEVPYGTVFREGTDRLGDASRRMLDRLALSCGAVVVHCDPGWPTMKKNFLARKHLEMLDNDHQLFQVRELYDTQATDLPRLYFNYLEDDIGDMDLSGRAGFCHPVASGTAGNWEAKIVLVGESFGEVKNQDPYYQWPFASFSKSGCSQWLANQLDIAGVREHQLLWVNADEDLNFLADHDDRKIVALGRSAADKLRRLPWGVGDQIFEVGHPQYHKRFGASSTRYPLVDLLKGLVK